MFSFFLIHGMENFSGDYYIDLRAPPFYEPILIGGNPRRDDWFHSLDYYFCDDFVDGFVDGRPHEQD